MPRFHICFLSILLALFVAPVAVTSQNTPTLKATLELRVRDCPSKNCQQISTIWDLNREYPVVGQSGSGLWLQIEFEGNSGWVCKQYTTVANSDLEVPFTSNTSEDCEGNNVPNLDDELQNSNPTFSRPLYTTSPRINGGDVRIVQSRIQELGYSPGTIDGYYGPLTEAAVRAFQSDKNLSVDGVVNEVTWNELFDITVNELRSTDSNDVSLTSQPTPTVSASTNGVIAYVAPDRGNAITLLDSQTLQPIDISNALTTSNVRTIQFSPNGQHLAYTTLSEQGSSLFVIDMDIDAPQPRMLVELFDGEYDWSPDSTSIVYSLAYNILGDSNPQGLKTVDVVTGQQADFIAPLSQASLSYPDWSPDGEFIRFVEVNERVGDNYIIARANGSIVNGAAISFRVGSDWSPDGSQFVFDDDNGYAELNRSLYLVNRDGTGQRPLYTHAGYSSVYPIWSPNGQYIAFWKQNDADRRQSSTWIINPVTGVPSEIPNSANSRPVAWSPDSTRLITIGESGTLIHSINGGEPVLLGAGYEVSWQPLNDGEFPPEVADRIVISRQPNQDFQYYLTDGCLMGTTSHQTMEFALLGVRYLVERIEGCDGYRVEVWSLGWPACQIQVNLSGPNGYEEALLLPAQPASIGCVNPGSQVTLPTDLPPAPPGFIWMSLDWYNEVYTVVYEQEQEWRRALEFQNWAEERGVEGAEQLLGVMADFVVRNGGSAVEFLTQAQAFLFGGSRADTQVNLQKFYLHRVTMERYRNDPAFVMDNYLLVPVEVVEVPLVSTPQFWNIFSNWIDFY